MKKLIVPILILFSSALFITEERSYLLMLIQSVAVPLSLGYLILALFYSFRSRWINVLASLGAMAMIYLQTAAPYTLSQEHAPFNNEPPVIVAHFNVLKFNYGHQEVINQSLQSNADIISFQEIDNKWTVALHEGLVDTYPYQYEYPQENNCSGLSVYSKKAIDDPKFMALGGALSFHGIATVHDTPINVTCIHTHSPISRYSFHNRNKQLRALSRFNKSLDGPRIVVGDLNAVPWDQAMENLKTDSRLNQSRTSYSGTYPTKLPSFGRIPIDHILYSPEILCHDFKALAPASSDHCGIVGTYSIKPQFALSNSTQNDPTL